MLREAVQWFAEQMEAKLASHDEDRGEAGWRDDDPIDLFDRLKDEATELGDALDRLEEFRVDGESTQERDDLVNGVLSEAADVGNFAMMIADRVRTLAIRQDRMRAEGVEVSAFTAARSAFNAYAGMDEPDLPSDPGSALQVRFFRWAQQFKNTLPMMVTTTLGINEEIGELEQAYEAFKGLKIAAGKISHVVLKHSQSIRGYDDINKCREEIADALADIAVFSMQLSTAMRLDYWTIVRVTARKVLARNWTANPLAAHTENR